MARRRSEAEQERLAAALRANLARRKAQSRQRQQDESRQRQEDESRQSEEGCTPGRWRRKRGGPEALRNPVRRRAMRPSIPLPLRAGLEASLGRPAGSYRHGESEVGAGNFLPASPDADQVRRHGLADLLRRLALCPSDETMKRNHNGGEGQSIACFPPIFLRLD
jgi:hypothetical protein